MSVALHTPVRRTSPDKQVIGSGDRAIRTACMLTTAFVALATWPVWRHTAASGDARPLLAHVMVLAGSAAVIAAGTRLPRVLSDWLPLTVGPYLYVALRWIIEGLGRPHRDAAVIAWERLFFPSDPSASLAPAWPIAPLSEILHLAYASYYLLIYLPPLALYLRGRRDAFASTVLALTVVYGTCFVIYSLFPVDGPRYLVGPADAPEGPVRQMVLALLERGSSRGTAFPSSHVAASIVAAVCALRFQRGVGYVVAGCAAGLTVATVYGGFHYAVDAVAGAALGLSVSLAPTRSRRAV